MHAVYTMNAAVKTVVEFSEKTINKQSKKAKTAFHIFTSSVQCAVVKETISKTELIFVVFECRCVIFLLNCRFE